ncbi:biotin synthase [Dendrosporobacter quercicolus]|uniref:Biotin synthase n=1 Tax=Dendrosporobacter quercicolus TaxID=146817 RepID=A0A1G9QFT3_9FIRM|nr:biotin synthase [Dendrosporobacter quercicolus]
MIYMLTKIILTVNICTIKLPDRREGLNLNALDIVDLGEKVLNGRFITSEEALALTATVNQDIPLLAAYANKIRQQFAGNTVDMCGIISARTGRCSENCKFCAQSVHHQTAIAAHPLLSTEAIVNAARQARANGAKRTSIVTSGRGMDNQSLFLAIVAAIQAIHRETDLSVCANLGAITPDQAKILAAAGVRRYAHNLETSRRFYPEICTTHSFEDRLSTIQAAQSAGLELCTGGIIGLGESWQDRIDLAFTLREIGVHSVPLNILNPIKGTALEQSVPPTPLECIKTFAIFRFILPGVVIRPAGGREINLRDMQGALMLSGVNGLIVGHYLTFTGRAAPADFTMVTDAGLFPA